MLIIYRRLVTSECHIFMKIYSVKMFWVSQRFFITTPHHTIQNVWIVIECTHPLLHVIQSAFHRKYFCLTDSKPMIHHILYLVEKYYIFFSISSAFCLLFTITHTHSQISLREKNICASFHELLRRYCFPNLP